MAKMTEHKHNNESNWLNKYYYIVYKMKNLKERKQKLYKDKSE